MILIILKSLAPTLIKHLSVLRITWNLQAGVLEQIEGNLCSNVALQEQDMTPLPKVQGLWPPLWNKTYVDIPL